MHFPLVRCRTTQDLGVMSRCLTAIRKEDGYFLPIETAYIQRRL